MASKIPNHKFQTSNKLQIPISKDQAFVSNLGDWIYLKFGAWDLVLPYAHALCLSAAGTPVCLY
jgi:hypothetical protein